MTYRWKTKHTWINGQRLRFTGSAPGLFGHWIKWFLLCVITLGIYSFWVYPRLQKWIVEHQELDPASWRITPSASPVSRRHTPPSPTSPGAVFCPTVTRSR